MNSGFQLRHSLVCLLLLCELPSEGLCLVQHSTSMIIVSFFTLIPDHSQISPPNFSQCMHTLSKYLGKI